MPLSAVVAGELSYVPQQILLMNRGDKPVTRYIVVSRGETAADKNKTFKITAVRLGSVQEMGEGKADGKQGGVLLWSRAPTSEAAVEGKSAVAPREETSANSVSNAHPGMDVQVRAVGRYGYRIRLGNVVAARELTGKQLVIETDVKAMPRITIPLRVEGSASPATQPAAPAEDGTDG